MIWIFALGIIGFCIVSAGFRKLMFGLAGFVACIAIGVLVYFKYQDYQQKQEDARMALDEASYPACVGKDQTQAWLAAGGQCRMDVNSPAAIPVAQSRIATAKRQ